MRETVDESSPSVLIFDGECVLCNGTVQWILRRDTRKRLRFAAAQTPAGIALLQAHNIPTETTETVWLISENRAYSRSEAVLRTLRLLGFPYAMLWVAMLIPPPLRDSVYGYIAQNRLRWFGKYDACRLPTAAERDRYIL